MWIQLTVLFVGSMYPELIYLLTNSVITRSVAWYANKRN
jgi:hypothetical protein